MLSRKLNVIKEETNKPKPTTPQSSPRDKYENNELKTSHATQDDPKFAAVRVETLTVLRKMTKASLMSGKFHTISMTPRNTKGRSIPERKDESLHRRSKY